MRDTNWFLVAGDKAWNTATIYVCITLPYRTRGVVVIRITPYLYLTFSSFVYVHIQDAFVFTHSLASTFRLAQAPELSFSLSLCSTYLPFSSWNPFTLFPFRNKSISTSLVSMVPQSNGLQDFVGNKSCHCVTHLWNWESYDNLRKKKKTLGHMDASNFIREKIQDISMQRGWRWRPLLSDTHTHTHTHTHTRTHTHIFLQCTERLSENAKKKQLACCRAFTWDPATFTAMENNIAEDLDKPAKTDHS